MKLFKLPNDPPDDVRNTDFDLYTEDEIESEAQEQWQQNFFEDLEFDYYE